MIKSIKKWYEERSQVKADVEVLKNTRERTAREVIELENEKEQLVTQIHAMKKHKEAISNGEYFRTESGMYIHRDLPGIKKVDEILSTFIGRVDQMHNDFGLENELKQDPDLSILRLIEARKLVREELAIKMAYTRDKNKEVEVDGETRSSS